MISRSVMWAFALLVVAAGSVRGQQSMEPVRPTPSADPQTPADSQPSTDTATAAAQPSRNPFEVPLEDQQHVAVVELTAEPAGSDGPTLRTVNLKNVTVQAALLTLSRETGQNIVCTVEAGRQTASLYLQNVSMPTVIETLCHVSNLWFRRDEQRNVTRLMTREEYLQDLVVRPEVTTRTFTLLYPNATIVAQQIEDLFEDRVELSLGVDERLSEGGTSSGGSTSGGRSYNSWDSTTTDNRYSGGLYRTSGTGYYRGRRTQLTPRTSDELRALEEARREDVRLGQTSAEPASKVQEELTRQDQTQTIYVSVNRPNNMVLVRTADHDALKQIEELIAELDRPTSQVLLEVKILEVTLTDGFHSVFDFNAAFGEPTSGNGNGQVLNPLTPGATPDAVSRNIIGSVNGSIAAGNSFVYQFLNSYIQLRLQLLESQNRVQSIGAPLLMCANNEVSNIFVGEERPMLRTYSLDTVTSESGITTQVLVPEVEMVDVGSSLEITPRINADRTVSLRIVQSVSSLTENGATLPNPIGGTPLNVDTTFSTEIDAVVVARDRMTIALGGLIQTTQAQTEDKVPVLGDLPGVGFFFRQKVQQQSKTERVLLITPYVMMVPDEAGPASRERLEALSSHPFLERGDKAMPYTTVGKKARTRIDVFDDVLRPTAPGGLP
ncbi:MAG: type II secretion system protein GspD [Planctomycetes bacterium]|nr:type II secretion system protein GspD [Planctomycetota bacterium]